MGRHAFGLEGYLAVIPILSMLGATALGVVLSPLDQYPGSSVVIASLIVCGMLLSIYAAIRVSKWYWLSVPLAFVCLWAWILSIGH